MRPRRRLIPIAAAAPRPPARQPMAPARIVLLVIIALILLSGLGYCGRAVLRSGHAGIVQDERDRCNALYDARAMSESEYRECLDAVHRLDRRYAIP